MIEHCATPCGSCRTAVVHAVNTRNGDRQAFDAAPAPDGAFVISAGHAGLVAEPLTVAQRFGRRLYRPHPTPCRRRPPARPPHQFAADESIPADPHDGTLTCQCGKRGRPGDPQHPAGAAPLRAE